MSKSTFVKAWLNNEDISDAVYFIRYESDVKKGDLIELRMRNINDIVNSKHVVAGAKLQFQYGFIGSFQSSTHVARLVNIDVDFAQNGILLNLKAVDKGIELKRGTSNRIWNNVTLSQIAETVANEYDLTPRVEPTQKVYHALPQGGRSEWEFLQYLVNREAGAYQLRVSDYTLFLERNARSKPSKRTYTYGEDIISLRVQLKEVTQKAQIDTANSNVGISNRTGLLGPELLANFGFSYSMADGSTTYGSIKRGIKEWETKDGRFSLDELTRTKYKGGKLTVVDKPLFQSKVVVMNDRDNNGSFVRKRLVYTPSDPLESEVLTNNVNEKTKTKVLTAIVEVELDPALKSGDMITLNTLVDRYNGNWFIETITHTVDRSGGRTEMTLNKNGTSKPVKATVTKNDGKVNSTEGGEGKVHTFRIYRDNNGGERRRGFD